MMEKKHFVVSAKGGPKKYFITFLAFLFTAVVVIAVFSLVTGKTNADWLRSDNGVSRETMFPFVFTSGDVLYVTDSKLITGEIDDGVENPVHDAELSRVYYTRSGELFEYNIDRNERTMLCDNVEQFFLFQERRSIVFVGEDEGIYIYDYNKKAVSNLCNPEKDESLPIVISGKEYIAYLKNYNSEKQTASLYVSSLMGKEQMVSENVCAVSDISIWENDKLISFHRDNRLVIASIEGKELATFENAYVVQETKNPVAAQSCTDVSEYGGDKRLCYIFYSSGGEKNANHTDKLIYVKSAGDKLSTVTVSENAENIVAFSSEESLIVYTVPSEESNFVFASRKGKTPLQITSCAKTDKLFFDMNSQFLYIEEPGNTLSFIDINDKKLTKTAVAENISGIYSYPGKSFTVFECGSMTGIILKDNKAESYSSDIVRLYGKYNDKYLMCRTADNGFYSLDYVREDKITRISGAVSGNVVFDKDIKNVIYFSDGEMFIQSSNGKISLGNYPEGFKSVRIVAEKN